MQHPRSHSEVLAYSTSLKIYHLGRLLYRLDSLVSLLDYALELYQHGAETLFQQWLEVAVLIGTGQKRVQDLDVSAVLDLVYSADSPHSLLITTHQIKELSAGVFPLEATERLNSLYHRLAQNTSPSNRSASEIREDLSIIAQTTTWLNGLLWKDWNSRDNVTRK